MKSSYQQSLLLLVFALLAVQVFGQCQANVNECLTCLD
jgi:hypothetical protein